MSELFQFFVSFEIKQEYGTDVENKIQDASINVIGHKAKYKFRVIGEAKIIAIFEVQHYSLMNPITSEITRKGFCNVTCTPLTHLESWQKLLGSRNSQYNLPQRLSGSEYLWFEVGYDHEAVCSLSNLSLDKQSKSQMIETKHWKIIETLEKLAKSPEEAVQNISKEALCTLHNNQTQLTECLQDITSEESNGKQSISDEESSPEEIKLLSWNIEGISTVNIKERTSAVIAFINSERPDVIFLQEVIVDTLEMLSRKCLDYTLIESAVESYFTVIMVKHKVVQVTDSKIIPFTSSTQGRTLQKVECTIKALPCVLMTSHLESMKTHSDERKHQMKRALHHVVNASRDRTVLFGGDFNIKDREIREMKGLPKGVLDLWIETGRNKETQFTWDTSINTNLKFAENQDFKPKIRFDRIYMRHPKTEPVISPVSFQLIGQEKIPTCDCFPSDHWGILVHFGINKSNTK